MERQAAAMRLQEERDKERMLALQEHEARLVADAHSARRKADRLAYASAQQPSPIEGSTQQNSRAGSVVGDAGDAGEAGEGYGEGGASGDAASPVTRTRTQPHASEIQPTPQSTAPAASPVGGGLFSWLPSLSNPFSMYVEPCYFLACR